MLPQKKKKTYSMHKAKTYIQINSRLSEKVRKLLY